MNYLNIKEATNTFLKKLMFPFYSYKAYRKIMDIERSINLIDNSISAHTDETIGVTREKRKPNLIVSLTSFADRVNSVYLVINSILNQTIKADRIVLWLSQDDFSDEILPYNLLKMKKRGLEIQYCKDIKSYKKLIYALQEFPDDLIVTADDDIIYPKTWLEELYNAYLLESDTIHCHRAKKIKLNSRREILPYTNWKTLKENTQQASSLLVFPVGVGGVLYKSRFFSKEVFNEHAFLEFCLTGDDIWFKAMTLINEVKCKPIPNSSLDPRLSDLKFTKNSLWQINKYEIDSQINCVFRKYDLIEKLSIIESKLKWMK